MADAYNPIPEVTGQATFAQYFNPIATQVYQNGEYLGNTIVERQGMYAATNMPLSQPIEMSQRGFGPAEIPPSTLVTTNKVVQPINWNLKTFISDAERTLYAYSLYEQHVRAHALASARISDYTKLYIGLLNDVDFSSIYAVPKTYGPVTGLSKEKISDALTQLQDGGVNVFTECAMWGAVPVRQSLMNDPQVTSILTYYERVNVTNKIERYLGLDLRWVSSAGINRMPFTTAGDPPINTFFIPIVHRDSMLQTFNIQRQTVVTRDQENFRDAISTIFTTGAGIQQAKGIKGMYCDNISVVNS